MQCMIHLYSGTLTFVPISWDRGSSRNSLTLPSIYYTLLRLKISITVFVRVLI